MRYSKSWALLALVSQVPITLSADWLRPNSIVDLSVGNNLTVGQGWDSATSTKKLSTCIEARMAQDLTATSNFSYQRVTDIASMMHSLSVSVSAQAHFLGGGGGGSMHFAETVKLDASDDTIVATAFVGNGAYFAIPTKVVPDGTVAIDMGSVKILPYDIMPGEILLSKEKADLAAADPVQFRKDCGDGFVSVVSTGGVIQILFDFQTQSEDETKTIDASLSGSFPVFSASASATNVLKKFNSSNRLKIYYFKEGGEGTPLPTSLDELTNSLNNFPRAVHDSPASISAEIAPYESLSNYPKGVESQNLKTLDAVVDMYYRFLYLERQVTEIADNSADYVLDHNLTKESIFAIGDKANAYREKLRAAAEKCLAENTCSYPDAVPHDDYSLRVFLPISVNSSAATQVRNKADRDADAAKTAFERTPKTHRVGVFAGFRPVGLAGAAAMPHISYKDVPNRDYSTAQAAMQAATAADAAIQAAYPEKILDERLFAWIVRPAQARCDGNHDELCLTAEQINLLRAKMVTGPP